MKADLYQDAIVKHARTAARAGRLAAPDASVTVDNPLCGDRVTIDVRLADDRIADIAHRVRGCLLCEASASVIGAAAIGRTFAAIEACDAALRALLENGDAGTALWSDLEAFAPVHAYTSRHACVLLPFEALRAAIAQARDSGRA